MEYHKALESLSLELDSAIEQVDLTLMLSLCQQGIALIKDNEPPQKEDLDVLRQFQIRHDKTQQILLQSRDKLKEAIGKSKHARKSINQYKGVSSNV